MKVEIECAHCLFYRGYKEILKATDDPNVRSEALKSLFKILSENFSLDAVPSVIGTMRERMIKQITGNPDPFADVKRRSNDVALKALPAAERLIASEDTDYGRFRRACLISIAGNAMEFDIPWHRFSLDDAVEVAMQNAEADLVIDDIEEAYNLARNASEILYLTDNAGEIVFDMLFIKELKRLGVNVVVAVKDKPVLNDATLSDAEYVGMHKVADKIITTGNDAMGLILSECSGEFLKYYRSVDLVVAKGMGYAETITEITPPSPNLLLLKTKCLAVANFFRTDLGKNVARIYPLKTGKD